MHAMSEKLASDFALFEKAVSAACDNVIAAEPEITKFDTIAGDGDCGLCLKAMTEGIKKGFQAGKIDKTDVTSAIVDIAAIVSSIPCTFFAR